MDLDPWFEKGMTWQQYVDAMKVNREEMLRIYGEFRLSSGDCTFYRSFAERGLRGIVLTADWCGDAMLCLPILKRISEVASIDLRFLIRDENPDLMDRYLTNGKSRSIPIFIFIDRDGREKAVWGPRSPEVQRLIDGMRDALPSENDPAFSEKQMEMYRAFKRKLLSEPHWRETVHRDVRRRFQEQLTSCRGG